MTAENIYVGNGMRSHRMDPSGGKTMCGIDIMKAAKNPASPGDPGCARCMRSLISPNW